MDVILYYMKLEDKYWGLFLVSLFLLFAPALVKSAKERKKYWFIALYGLSAYLLFICPLTYKLLTSVAPDLSSYYELSHIELVVPIVAYAFTIVAKKAWEQGKEKFYFFMIGFFVLLFFAGDFVYLPTYKSQTAANSFDKEETQAYDMLLAHGENRQDESLRIWAMDDFMAKSRIYNDAFCPIYGKDVEKHPETYNESLRNMHTAYNTYDSENSTVINIKDQLDAIGSFPYLYPETECEYVVLYNPSAQFEEYEEYVAGSDYDPVKNITGLGYEFVGETERYLLFYRAVNAGE